MKKIFWLVVLVLALISFSCGGSSVKTTHKNDKDDTSKNDIDYVDDHDNESKDEKESPDDYDDNSVCGDGKIEGKEVCEPDDVIDCININPLLYDGGKAKCQKDCLGWNTVTCDEIPIECGNEIVEGPEICDSTSVACSILDPEKYEYGTAHCKDTCDGWNTDDCVEFEPSDCGNNIVEGSEVCDGNIIDCVDLNSTLYQGGKAKCKKDCKGWDTATCDERETPVCTDKCFVEGNKRCNSNNIEECKRGTNGCLDWSIDTYCNSYTCQTSGGTTQCVPNCTNQCTLNHKKCEDNNVMKCVTGTDGCTEWSFEENCTISFLYPFCGPDGATSAKCYTDPQSTQEYIAKTGVTYYSSSTGSYSRGMFIKATQSAVITGFKIHLQGIEPGGDTVAFSIYENDAVNGTYTRIYRSQHLVGANGYYGPTGMAVSVSKNKFYFIQWHTASGTGFYYECGTTFPTKYPLKFGETIGNKLNSGISEPGTTMNLSDPHVCSYRMWIESYLH